MSWLIPPLIKKESKWKFNTFGTVGGGSGFVAASGGTIVLDDPTGKPIDFWYGGMGPALSTGIKIGTFKIKLPESVTIGPIEYPSMGRLFVLHNLEKDELSKSDIQGPCMFFEVGAGLVFGGSGTAMFVGLNPWFIPFLANPSALYNQAFINSAKGLLFMAGVNKGYQAGAGVAGLIGYLR